MVQISSLFAVATVAATFGRVNASPMTYGGLEGGVKGELSKRAVVLATLNSGIQPIPTGPAPVRREFRDFERDIPALNLYLMGLNRLMAKSQDDVTSYFQIAGIHGRPFVTWDGVTGGNNNGGYCTHADILFLTWHRPYLALYEGALYAEVQKIASEFTTAEAAVYQESAKNWRMPYWDWARYNASVPALIGRESQVRVPNPKGGDDVTIPNPLFSYQYHFSNGVQQNQFPDQPFRTARQTTRVQFNTLNQRLANIATSLTTRVYNLLTAYNDFASFSNKGTTTAINGQVDSLESVHDVIHATVGGNSGEMAYVDYAAMDALFWLHHTNIDRLFAIWQEMRTNSSASFLNATDRYTNQFGTFSMRAGSRQNSQTPLSPFHKSDRDFYTSDDVKSTRAFGYVYPETVGREGASDAELRAMVISQVNSIYGKDAPAGVLTSVSSITNSMSSTTSSSRTSTSTTRSTTTTTTSSSSSVRTTTASSSSAAAPSTTSTTMVRVSTTASSTSTSSSRAPQSTTSSSRAPQSTTAAALPSVVPNPPNPPSPSPPDNRNRVCQELAWWQWAWTGNWHCFWQSQSGRSGEEHRRRFELGDAAKDIISDTIDAVGDTINVVGRIIDDAIDSLPSIGELVDHAASLISGDLYVEYTAQVKTLNNALSGTYTVYVFLGEYSQDPKQWPTEKNLVGVHSAFTNLGGGHKYTGAGSVPLTASIIHQIVDGKLANLGREAVVPYLQKNLRWEVATAAGEAIPNKDVQGLKVSIVSSDVKLPCAEGSLPLWGQAKTEYDITQGKVGGLCVGETML
ncbi:hypothetical protein DRE_01290 [Drechslerella stenobrocha 248]|uniref:tyrosinase n=1 Tax=Drechslerella stenobrocha 248 TaxID=1043628 RepID=W7HVJ8_9PEZI|nr:hypothetical protein DRE_01290 [Drechslerella stenobrocha 248]